MACFSAPAEHHSTRGNDCAGPLVDPVSCSVDTEDSPARADLDHRFLTPYTKWPKQSLPSEGMWRDRKKNTLVSSSSVLSSSLLSRFPSKLPRESAGNKKHPACSLPGLDFKVPPLSTPKEVPDRVYPGSTPLLVPISTRARVCIPPVLKHCHQKHLGQRSKVFPLKAGSEVPHKVKSQQEFRGRK